MRCQKCGKEIVDDKYFLYNYQPTHIECPDELRINYDMLSVGSKVRVKTRNSTYLLEKIEIEGQLKLDTFISGGYFERKYNHPVKVRINGCTWGGSMLKIGMIEKDMHLEMVKNDGRRVTTSSIKSVEVLE